MQLLAEDLVVGVVGAGAMGQGIVQVAVAGGIKTLILDQRPGAAAEAIEKISGRLNRLVEKGKMDQPACDHAISLMTPCEQYDQMAPAHVVVEAVFEELAAKRDVFQNLEKVVGNDCILTSNTSSIPIASIASACRLRKRVAGFHFFNPVPLMKLVEVIGTTETDEDVLNKLMQVGRLMTRTPVLVKDAPGFLVNMGGSAFTTEGFTIFHENIATPAQVDAIMRDCHHFRMGPFELGDLTGIDVNYPVRQIIYNGYNQDPRIKTTPEHKAMFDAGRYGRKTFAGWYDYAQEDMQGYAAGEMIGRDAGNYIPKGEAGPVALAEETELLAGFVAELGLEVVPDDGRCPLVAAPIGWDATETALRLDVDHRRLVCVDPLGARDKRITIMMAPGHDPSAGDLLAASLVRAGRQVTWINDSAGFVGQRMVAMVANLGCYMAEIGLASCDDIDLAMRLGLNYPMGPLELVEQHGAANILTVLEAAQHITGSDRYRATTWLRRRARLQLSIRSQ